MFKRLSTCVLSLLISAQLMAADREIKGKLVEVDVDDRSVTVQTDAGKTSEFTIGAASKVHDARGVSNFGFKDARLKPGATVRVVLPEKGNTIKELHFVASAPSASRNAPSASRVPPKTEAMKGAARRTAPPKESTKDVAAKESGTSEKKTADTGRPTTARTESKTKAGESTARKTTEAEKKTHTVKGVEAKLLKIDKDKRWIQVEMTEGGRKAEYTLGEGVEFVGPRGGVSEDEFEDDRFVVGNTIHIEMDAGNRKVTRIHLPYRPRAK